MKGRWGWNGTLDACSAGALEPLISDGFGCAAFRDSPYGFTYTNADPATLTPYLIDPATLAIEYRPDLAIVAPLSGDLVGLDDSTIITAETGNLTLYVITRSGITISVSGGQQTVATALGSANVCRIDSSHFTRVYNPPSPNDNNTVIETFSVSGSTISLIHTDTIVNPAPAVSHDPGGAPVALAASQFFPFHYNAGTLYSFSTGYVLATPYTTGGGIGGTVGPSTRAADAPNISLGIIVPAKKIGSSECLLLGVVGEVPFYDDGANMHFDDSGLVFPAIEFNQIGGPDEASSWGDYLTGNVLQFPSGTTDNSGPALVSQSGQTLGYSTISPQFLCPALGTNLFGTRHLSNLGAQMIDNPFDVDGRRLLRAYKW